MSKGVPVFFFERLTDLLALVLLSLLGVKHTNWSVGDVVLIVLGGLLVLFLFTNPLFWKLLFGLIGHTPKKGPFKLMLDISENIQMFWRVKTMCITILLSVLGWFMECVGYYLVFRGFGLQLSLTTASFIYAFSSVLGAVSFLPGGLGITDGSLTALSTSAGIGKAISVASTFIIRAFTLWFAVLVGIIFLVKLQGGLGNEEASSISGDSNRSSMVGDSHSKPSPEGGGI